jgi:hypothetical protein
VVEVAGKPVGLSVVECGHLSLGSGRLLCRDAFSEAEEEGLALRVPPGRYPVRLTLADMSGRLDGSELAEAYLTIVLAPGEEASLRPLAQEGDAGEDDELDVVEVGSDAIAIVDAAAFERCMPDPETWVADVFEGGDEPWYELLDDPDEIREGVANLVLPLADEGENIILCQAGWGDGRYPLIGSFDDSDRVLAIHVDLQVMAGADANTD